MMFYLAQWALKLAIVNNRFRQELHISSPALNKIAKHMAKDGFYYFGGSQKRKVTNYRRDGSYVVLEGIIL